MFVFALGVLIVILAAIFTVALPALGWFAIGCAIVFPIAYYFMSRPLKPKNKSDNNKNM